MLLMHKDIPVAEIAVTHGQIQNVIKIYNKEHMPVGTKTDFQQLEGRLLENWNKMRTISSERKDLSKIKYMLTSTIEESKIKNMAVSLTDCYWLKDTKSIISWKEVNYHENGFASDFSEAILYDKKIGNINTPDLTTDGALIKTWIILNNKPVLLKFGDNKNEKEENIQCANEIVASKIAELMNINHIKYFPFHLDKNLICGCECFTNNSVELVNALQMIKEQKCKSGIELYKTFKRIGMKKEVDNMILFDHIIHNIDRHEKNFGILRDADTLETIGFAPLFDSGSSLGWSNSEMKPFLCGRKEQLNLIDNIHDIPEPKLLKTIIQETYQQFNISERSFCLACKEIDESFNILKTKSA